MKKLERTLDEVKKSKKELDDTLMTEVVTYIKEHQCSIHINDMIISETNDIWSSKNYYDDTIDMLHIGQISIRIADIKKMWIFDISTSQSILIEL